MKRRYIVPETTPIIVNAEPYLAAGSPNTMTTDKETGLTNTGEGAVPQCGGDGDGSDMGAKRWSTCSWDD